MSEQNEINRPQNVLGEERIIKDLMYCAGFLRNHTEGKGSQRRVLFFLREHGPMTQREILEEMGVRASSLSELLSKLEAKGYVKKEKSETDKRNYNVSITDEGIQALEEMHVKHQAAMSDLLSDLSPEERRQLAALLEKLHTAWSQRPDAPPPHHGHGPKCAHRK
ncbi:MAG: MarR family winged helix-turn-helix transcriptional regulator [Oscillospiraceae bacterium]